MTPKPIAPVLGAEIDGLDLRALDDASFNDLREAWHRYQVLVIHGQTLSHEDLITFSRRFGDLDLAPIQEGGRRFVAGIPELYVVSNVVENGVPIGSLGAGELVWHTDMSYLDQPPMASMLYAVEIPPVGGSTWFSSMYGAYEGLPAALQQRISGLIVKHDGTYNSGGFVRYGVTETGDPRTSPGALHPLVCTHPASGRKGLYLGRRRNAYIEGMDLAASEALLNEVWSTVDRHEIAYEHHWQLGDVVLWDNRCTMHRRDPFDSSARRMLYRTQIKSTERPTA